LNEENVQDLSESINAFMLAEGLALIDQEAIGEDKTPEEV